MSAKTVSQKSVQTMLPRQWIRLIVVYLSIPLVLLVCGGDFGWWQAWLYSLLIFAAGIGGRIWAEQRHPGLLAERQSIENIKSAKTWDKVLAPLMALSLAFPMVIVAGLDHRYGWSPVFPLWLIVIGFILITLGYAFAAWALAENRFFSAWCAFRWIEGMWCVTVARSGLFGTRVMPEIFCHCWALFLPSARFGHLFQQL
jgi:hypothetical protein